MRPPQVRFTVRRMMVLVAVAATLFGVLAAVRANWLASRRVSLEGACWSSLHNTAFGLANYREVHGHFPPPYTTDDQGRRTHSWRILVLRWFPMRYPQAFSYDYTDRWDGIANSKLSSKVPGFLLCPSERNDNPHGSPFVMINDFSTADPRDIPANAILVIEAWGANQNWLDPRDRIETFPRVKVEATDHPNGFGVILGDLSRVRVKDAGRIRKEGQYYVLAP